MNVNIFIPCFIDQLYPQTGFNMVKVLEKAGCDVSYNKSQTCCGQPAFNAGFWDDARDVAEKFIKDFDSDSLTITPSASCCGFVRNYYPKVFEHSALFSKVNKLQENIFEFTEFIINKVKTVDFGARLEGRATYHDSCAALRECGIKEGPRKLLQQVKGLELVEMKDVETCCGFGGTFSVKFENISIAMADQKLDHAMDTGASYIISTDMSCLMQLDGRIKNRNLPLTTLHIADVLAQGW